jgi:hypothetical protein
VYLHAGLSFLTPIVPGIIPFSIDSTTFMILVIAEQASPWPTCGFVDPIYKGSCHSRWLPNTFPIAVVSIGSPAGVPVPWHST